MVLTKLSQEKRYKDKIWKFLDKTISNKNMFCIKKKKRKRMLSQSFPRKRPGDDYVNTAL